MANASWIISISLSFHIFQNGVLRSNRWSCSFFCYFSEDFWFWKQWIVFWYKVFICFFHGRPYSYKVKLVVSFYFRFSFFPIFRGFSQFSVFSGSFSLQVSVSFFMLDEASYFWVVIYCLTNEVLTIQSHKTTFLQYWTSYTYIMFV